jgi:NAD(P)-dependent dehydrogenase (short-subunit alcohol dehydrogenase family)
MSSTKSILITGCSTNGIGAALAHVLARRGHHIFATARDPAKIPEALRSLTNATILLLDVENTASVVAAAQAVAHSGRGLDVPVNNAGAGYARPVLDMDNAAVQRVHDIDFWGPTRTAQVFADLLIASRGRVVNVSSSASVTYSPWVCTFSPISLVTSRHTTHLVKWNCFSILHRLTLSSHSIFKLQELFKQLSSKLAVMLTFYGICKTQQRRTPLPRPH